MLDDPVDRRDDLRNVGAAVRRRDLEADDPRVRGDADVGRRRRAPVRRDRRGDCDQWHAAGHDLAGHRQRLAAQGARLRRAGGQRRLRHGRHHRALRRRRAQALDRRHAGVDDGDVDSVAGVARAPPGLRAEVARRRRGRVRVGRRVVRACAPARPGERAREREHDGQRGKLRGEVPSRRPMCRRTDLQLISLPPDGARAQWERHALRLSSGT